MTEGQKPEHRRQTSTGKDCELGLLDSSDKDHKNDYETPKDETTTELLPQKHQNVACNTAPAMSTTTTAATTKVNVGQPVVVGGVVNPNIISASRAWNVSTVRGKMTDRCLWSVCKAMTLGVFLIATGAGMATLGYYSDRLSTVPERRGNETVMVKNEKRDSQLNILTYLGPVVMGVGGFIIVAACVMTFEARDTAPKIVPVWFRKNRPQVVPSTSTGSVNSSRTSWERFLVRRNLASNRSQIKSQSSEKRQTNHQREFRNSVNDSLINFGKFLQSSIESGKLSPVAPRSCNRTMAKTLRKCPSESDILRAAALNKRSPSDCRGATGGEEEQDDNPEAEKLLKPEQRVDNVLSKNLLAPPSFYRGGSPTPHRPSIGGQKYFRQAVSMDYQGERGSDNLSCNTSALESGLGPNTGNVNLMVDGQTKYDSNNSMAMDLYLPQGSFTLKVKEEKRNQGGTSPCGGGGGHHNTLGFRSSSNASSASGAKSTPPGSRRHTPQSSFDRNLRSLSRDSSRSSGGGYRTPQQSISRNNSGARSPMTHTSPSLSRNNSGATAEMNFRTPQAVSRNNSGTRSPHSRTPPNLSRNNSGANNASDISYRRNTCIPHSPNWLKDKSFSRFEGSQDENDPQERVRTDSFSSNSSRGKKQGNKNNDNSSEGESDPKDQDGQSSASKRHPFVRQRALENKPETES